MNILFVTHRLPYPPAGGAKVRAFHVIKHFAESGHAVTVASLARSDKEAEEGQGLEKYCAATLIERISEPQAMLAMVARLPTATPSSMAYFYSRTLDRKLKQLLLRKSFDLIMVHSSSVAPYVAHVVSAPKILDFVDMDSQKWLMYSSHRAFPLSVGYWLEGRKLEKAEKDLASMYDLCTCATAGEVDTLRSFNTNVPADWFPNGVDAGYFSPQGGGYDPNRICFIGRMDYFPNEQAVLNFCRDVLPAIRAQRPSTQLFVVGAAPTATVRALHGKDGVTVTGTVDDVRPYVQGAALTIAPLVIARGTQNKILESMAMGVPVVASKIAARGVDADPGRDLLAADLPAELAATILDVLEHPERRKQLAEAGRARVLSHHSWPAAMQRMDGLVTECMARAPLARAASA